jgi:3-isopropylmalate/(R)-2-methylmalate dehydratase large subunit
MGSTIIEKVLARTAGLDKVVPGQIVTCRPDMVMFHELQIAVEGLWYRPTKVFDKERVSLVYDHAVPAPTIKDAAGMQEGRRFAHQFGLKHFYDVGHQGICHVVAAEKGLARPGELFVCPDSHTCAGGAMNSAARGTGALDTIQALTDGSVWYPVSPTIRYVFEGSLPEGINGKDVFFYIAQVYGGHSGYSVEFGGPGLKNVQMSDRRTIAAMCAEISAEFAIFEYDEVTEEYLKGRLEKAAEPANPDSDATYAEVRTIDLSTIEPYVVRPDYIQKNAVPMSLFSEKIHIDQAFIGSCANGQIEDIRVAAEILKGRKIADGVRMIITPGSQAIALQAAREGLVETILEAGAVFTNSTCGACYGGHMGLLAPGEVCLTASTRNFKGRMGSMNATIYMGSPATVAASAIVGYIVDPRTIATASVH